MHSDTTNSEEATSDLSSEKQPAPREKERRPERHSDRERTREQRKKRSSRHHHNHDFLDLSGRRLTSFPQTYALRSRSSSTSLVSNSPFQMLSASGDTITDTEANDSDDSDKGATSITDLTPRDADADASLLSCTSPTSQSIKFRNISSRSSLPSMTKRSASSKSLKQVLKEKDKERNSEAKVSSLLMDGHVREKGSHTHRERVEHSSGASKSHGSGLGSKSTSSLALSNKAPSASSAPTGAVSPVASVSSPTSGRVISSHSPPKKRLPRLSWLYLHRNMLTSLDTLLPHMPRLKNLRVLTLYRNQLESLPSEIGRLHALEVLCLQNNYLRFLPPEMGELANLRWLYLQNNQLKTVPSSLGMLDQSLMILLDGNPLDTPLSALVAQGNPISVMTYLRNTFQEELSSANGAHNLVRSTTRLNLASRSDDDLVETSTGLKRKKFRLSLDIRRSKAITPRKPETLFL